MQTYPLVLLAGENRKEMFYLISTRAPVRVLEVIIDAAADAELDKMAYAIHIWTYKSE